jgi:hypothetical protein
MLPPFRIRHLKASDNPSGPDLGDDFLSSPVYRDEDAVIAISEPDYDSLIISHPEAALTYLDEDDGEIITVSSRIIHIRVRLTLFLDWFVPRARTTLGRAYIRNCWTRESSSKPVTTFPVSFACASRESLCLARLSAYACV